MRSPSSAKGLFLVLGRQEGRKKENGIAQGALARLQLPRSAGIFSLDDMNDKILTCDWCNDFQGLPKSSLTSEPMLLLHYALPCFVIHYW